MTSNAITLYKSYVSYLYANKIDRNRETSNITGYLSLSKKKTPSTTRESLREQITGKREDNYFNVDKREIQIMTRLSSQIVQALDALIALNVFKSRSEAVAAYVENSIIGNSELYEKLIKKATEVSEIRDTAMDSILETLDE